MSWNLDQSLLFFSPIFCSLKFFLISVVIFGCCCGNTFTFLTVTKMNKLKSFETSSVSVYLGALAVADFSSAFWDGFINITLPNYFDFKASFHLYSLFFSILFIPRIGSLYNFFDKMKQLIPLIISQKTLHLLLTG